MSSNARVCRYSLLTPDPSTQEPFRGEQHHLRVVGDRAEASISRRKAGDAHWSEGGNNVGPTHEFDRRTERIAYGATQHAPEEAILRRGCQLLRAIGSAHRF